MFDFHERRRIKRFLYSKGSLVLILIVVIYLAVQVYQVYQKERNARLNREESAAALSELEERERLLTEEIDRLSTDRGVEEEIRSKFEVAREGESVIVIVEPDGEKQDRTEERGGFFSRILDWF